MLLSLAWKRALISLTTFPTVEGWVQVGGVTVATVAAAGMVATVTGFVDPRQDFAPPESPWKPCSAFLFPSLFEEVIWRGALLPRPIALSHWTPWMVLLVHVASHPVAAWTVWPRGREVFGDVRFLCLATLVLGGTTCSFIATGGSVWAAAFTHGTAVALWRDYFGGEAKLMAGLQSKIGGPSTKKET